MVKCIMSKNVICYLSEIGHKNFYYPTKTKVVIEKNTKYEILPWISTDKKLQAIKVKNSSILHITTLSKLQQSGESVLWIKKNKLPLSSVG